MRSRAKATAAVLALGLALVASGCSLEPKYVRPDIPVPASWPVGDAYLRQSEVALPSLSHRAIFRDERLQAVIAQALANNRDLRIAAANIEIARGQFRIQRAARFPTVSGALAGSYAANSRSAGDGVGSGGTTSGSSRFSTNIGISAFEIDLFGRVASLTRAEQARFFATEAAARATRLILVSDIADAWLTYGADRSLLAIAEDTVANAQRSVELTRLRLDGGIAPRTDLRQAEQILATAQGDLAEQQTALAQDINALQLLVGAPIDRALLPDSIDSAAASLGDVPAGTDSTVLLRRPDVIEAEYQLRAANAEIGAARAALFPRITIGGLIGLSAPGLANLFSGNALSYSTNSNVGVPIFRAGAGRAGVAVSQAQRDAAVASYERQLQTAFREVVDALALRGTIDEQARASASFVAAAADSLELTELRYRGGIDPFLAQLDAQRSLYSARRQQASLALVAASNRVALYRTIGADSFEEPSAP